MFFSLSGAGRLLRAWGVLLQVYHKRQAPRAGINSSTARAQTSACGRLGRCVSMWQPRQYETRLAGSKGAPPTSRACT